MSDNGSSESLKADDILKNLTAEKKRLLDVAVKFLTNPKVLDYPSEKKIAFLKKKGLNDAEIQWVIKQSNVPLPNVPSSSPTLPPHPPLSIQPPVYTWQQIIVGGVMIGGIIGAVIYWIKRFLESLMDRRRVQEQRMDTLESTIQQLQSNINTVVTEMQESTQAIKALVEKQQNQLESTNSLVTKTADPVVTEHALKTIQSELSTIKGLLLNRHQFPSLQRHSSSPGGGIPAWQRTQNTPPVDVPLPVVPSISPSPPPSSQSLPTNETKEENEETKLFTN